MSIIAEQKLRERKNEILRIELIKAINIIVNPSGIRIFTVGNNNCHLQTDVNNEFHIIQSKLTEVISKIISNNKL